MSRFFEKEHEVVEYDHFLGETSMAYNIMIGKKDYWIPKSRCVLYKVSKEIHIELWLAEKKGLVNYGKRKNKS